MKQLTSAHESSIAQFREQLSVVVGPDDMFPPDATGVREPLPRPTPERPAAESLCLAGIHKGINGYRRAKVLAAADRIIGRIDNVIELQFASC